MFSEDVMKYIAYIEIVVGLGLGIGPTLGSAVYGTLQYANTMYFFGVINLIGMFACILMLPK
jgi:hypothetical protein